MSEKTTVSSQTELLQQKKAANLHVNIKLYHFYDLFG